MSADELANYYHSECASNWDGILRFYEKTLPSRPKPQWIFRGQHSSCRGLETSLERAIKDLDLKLSDAPDLECGLLREFQRRAHHYLPHVPEEKNYLEWFALMRHYGAPTRLLDWTYSFFVALYFAVESADKQQGCAVWAINSDWMRGPVDSVIRQHPNAFWYLRTDPNVEREKTFRAVFMRRPGIPVVGAVNPHRLNERLTIQQGIFLCPGDVGKPFKDNLIELLRLGTDTQDNFRRLIVCPTEDSRRRILLRLHSMNMDRATLFPGLQGFAESLWTRMSFLHPGREST